MKTPFEKVTELNMVANNVMADTTRRLMDRRDLEALRPQASENAAVDQYRSEFVMNGLDVAMHHIDMHWQNIQIEPDEAERVKRSDYHLYILGALRHHVDQVFDHYTEDMIDQKIYHDTGRIEELAHPRQAPKYRKAAVEGMAQARELIDAAFTEVEVARPQAATLEDAAEQDAVAASIPTLIRKGFTLAAPEFDSRAPATPVSNFMLGFCDRAFNTIAAASLQGGQHFKTPLRLAGHMLSEVGTFQRYSNARIMEAHSPAGVQMREYLQVVQTLHGALLPFRTPSGHISLNRGLLLTRAEKEYAAAAIPGAPDIAADKGLMDQAVQRISPIFEHISNLMAAEIERHDGWAPHQPDPRSYSIAAPARLQ